MSGPMAIGTESERDRDKRHYQRALFDGIAERYEASRPGYPPRVTEFAATTAGLGPGDELHDVCWVSGAGDLIPFGDAVE